MTEPKRITIRHASGQRDDPKADQRTYVDDVTADPGFLFLGLTEVGHRENRTVQPLLEAAAKRHGYRLFLPPAFGEGIVVNLPPNGRIVRHGYDGPYVKGIPGEFPARGARWVTVELPHIGRLSYIVFHSNAHDSDPERHADNILIATKVTKLARRLGHGTGIVFASADTNTDDAHNGPNSSTRPLAAAGLVSCWDETGEYPATLARTVDVIYRSDHDTRVTLRHARGLTRSTSDHRPIEATYDVTALPPA